MLKWLNIFTVLLLGFQLTNGRISSDTSYEISNFTPQEMKALLEAQELVTNRISILISDVRASSIEIGKVIDEFLTTRPWWYVEKEPYDWNFFSQSPKHVVLKMFRQDVTKLFRKFASTQYSNNCQSQLYRIDYHDGFDSLGHYFSGIDYT
jgi:hypothetical protein